MKKVIFALFAVPFVALAEPSIGHDQTGGAPPYPLSVVLQGYLENGQLDEEGHKKALALVGLHIAQDRVTVFTHRPEHQYSDRSYYCIQYKNFADFNLAIDEFKAELANHKTLVVVRNRTCE